MTIERHATPVEWSAVLARLHVAGKSHLAEMLVDGSTWEEHGTRLRAPAAVTAPYEREDAEDRAELRAREASETLARLATLQAAGVDEGAAREIVAAGIVVWREGELGRMARRRFRERFEGRGVPSSAPEELAALAMSGGDEPEPRRDGEWSGLHHLAGDCVETCR